MDFKIRQLSTTTPLPVTLVSSSDHVTPVLGAVPKVLTLSKACTPWVAPQGAWTEIGNGDYQIAPNANDVNTPGPNILHVEANGCDPVDLVFEVLSTAGQSMAYQGSISFPLPFLLIATPGKTAGQPGVLLSSITVKLSKDGGAFAAPAGATFEIGGTGNGYGNYAITANALDMSTPGPLTIQANATGCLPVDLAFYVTTTAAASVKDGYGPGLGMLRNQVDLYRRVPTKDKDKGTVPVYQLYLAAVRCLVEQGDVEHVYDDDQQKIFQEIPYKVLFASHPGLTNGDMMQWTDAGAIVHQVRVSGVQTSGRGAAMVLHGRERL